MEKFLYYLRVPMEGSLYERGRRVKAKERDVSMEAEFGVGDFEDGGRATPYSIEAASRRGRRQENSSLGPRRNTALLTHSRLLTFRIRR